MDTSVMGKEFLHAVETNDIAKVSSLLQLSQQNDTTLDINASIAGQTPLTAAITAKHIDMTLLLLEKGAKSDDVLFYCIDAGSEALLTRVCEMLKAISHECLETTLSIISSDVNFKPVSNPLMFAARENRHEIVKILIEYGATLPDLQTILGHSDEDPYEQYLACYSWHQAISSEAYLLYASNDPIQAAIDAGKAVLKSKSAQKNHLQSDYEELIEQLDRFVTKFFATSRSDHEIHNLLWNKKDTSEDEIKRGAVPQSIQDLLELKYKKLISSTTIQQYVLDQWYMEWQSLSTLGFMLWTALVIIFQPVLCLLYLIFPLEKHRLIMKTPYMRFLVHWVSRIYFIGFIVYLTASEQFDNFIDSDLTKYQRLTLVFEYVTQPPSVMRIVTYVWILGMTWREIRELYSGGFLQYWKDVFNYSDILQLALYWSALVWHMLSFVKRREYVHELCMDLQEYRQGVDVDDMGSFDEHADSVCEILTTDNIFIRDDDNSSVQDVLPTINAAIAHLGPAFIIKTDDPALLGDVFFGIATVLSLLALLRDFVIIAFVGPLRASFGGMMSDIGRFLILFFFVWISFALGMTQLYVTYDLIEVANCFDEEREDEGCKQSPFSTLSESLNVLFWSLFNPIDKEGLRIDPAFKTTLAVGETLYAIYMVVAVVVMLNALIAMMSNTYTRVEENSEVEWKFARTNLMVGYMTTSATLPPPFNLLPTLRMICNWICTSCKRICKCCRSDNPLVKTGEGLELQEDKSYKTLMETLSDRYVQTYVSSDNENASDLKQELADVKKSLESVDTKLELILQYIEYQQSQTPRSSMSPAKKLFFKE